MNNHVKKQTKKSSHTFLLKNKCIDKGFNLTSSYFINNFKSAQEASLQNKISY